MHNSLLLGTRFSKTANMKPTRLLSVRGKAVRKRIIRKLAESTMVMEEVPCPCGETRFERFAERDGFGLPIGTVICLDCGLLRSNPRPTPETYAKFYQEHMFRDLYIPQVVKIEDKEDPDKGYREMEAEWGRVFLDELRPFLPKRKGLKILEVGCGPGGIMLPFLEEGHQCIGVDLDKRFVEKGRALGLDLRVGFLSDVPDLCDVDLIITNHYLEHVTDLNSELEEFKRRLKPESGILFIGVPGLRSLAFQMQHDFLELIQFAHTFIYDLPTLDSTLGRFGFIREFGTDLIDSIYRNTRQASAPPSPNEVARYIEETKEFLLQMEKKRKKRAPYNMLSKHLYYLLGAGRITNIKKCLRVLKRS